MGSKGSVPVTTHCQDDIDYKNVEDTREEYPPPYIPQSSRRDVYDPDVAAGIQKNVNEIPAGTDATYSSLLKHLKEGLTKEVHHVTAIYLWMKAQDYEDASLEQVPDTDTPRGYMKLIRDGQGDYTTFFTILCRRSNVPCIILRGAGKDEKYFVGQPERQLRSKWTAVFADNEWHLAHVQWAIDTARDGNRNYNNPEISDFYFLTDPDKFALMCSPEDFRWQLLNHAHARREFMGFPNVRPSFFLLNTTLLSPQQGTIRTSKSKTEIELSFPRKAMVNMQLSFRYSFLEPLHVRHRDEFDDDDEDDEEKPNVPRDLAKYVFINRKPSKFVFEIGLPTKGKYLFDIYGAHIDETEEKDKDKQEENESDNKETNETDIKTEKDIKNTTANENDKGHSNESNTNIDTGNEKGPDADKKEGKPKSKMESIVQYRLIADLDPDPDELETNPDCPDAGWGPGPRCRDAGLTPVSNQEGCIYMKPGEEREVTFRMTRKVDVMAQLLHDSLPIYELVDLVDCRTKRRDVTVTVKIEEYGRYALKVFSREPGTKGFDEACVYLIRQRNPPRFTEKYRDKMLRSRLEHHVTNNTSEQELADALEMHECYYVPDQGEKNKANEKLVQYWEVKRELNCAVKGRNYHKLEKWLDRAKKSPYQADLQEDIERAESVHDRMTRRKGYLHPIARLDQHSIHEIRTYSHPPVIIPHTMQATYLLLGEKEDDVESWEQIQYLMQQQGSDSLQRRILTRQADDVDPATAQKVDNILQNYSLDKCRGTSTNIGSFYKWCKQFTRDVKQKDMDNSARNEDDRSLDGRETYRDMPSRDGTQDTQRSDDYTTVQMDREDSQKDRDDKSAGRESPQDNREEDNKSPAPKLGINPEKPASAKKRDPVSYAGFKPQGM